MPYNPTKEELEGILTKLDSWIIGYAQEKSRRNKSLGRLEEIERNLFFYFTLLLYIYPPDDFDVKSLLERLKSKQIVKSRLTKKLYRELVEPAIKHLKRFLYRAYRQGQGKEE